VIAHPATRGVRSGLRRARGVVAECELARHSTAGLGSFARCATDVVLSRGLRYWDLPGRDRERGVRFVDGGDVRYRLNRGDIQTIREVWLQECYRPPVEVPANVVVDLGANIGLTSLWYAKRYGAGRLLCVEPVAENARLARRNLSANAVTAEVVEAAVAASDGMGFLEVASDFNAGRLGSRGRAVRTVSMQTLLGHLPDDQVVDLLKVDIEGGEAELFSGRLDWLERVQAIIAELHPHLGVDRPAVAARLEGCGFRYVPAGCVRWNSMDFWFRPRAA
jgi:FkbM family methyltransferase